MNGDKKYYQAKGKKYAIPENKIDGFLKDFPDAEELLPYSVNNKTFKLPKNKVNEFLKDFPDAKPLYNEKPIEQKAQEEVVEQSPQTGVRTGQFGNVGLSQGNTDNEPSSFTSGVRNFIANTNQTALNIPADLAETWAIASAFTERQLSKIGVPFTDPDISAKDIDILGAKPYKAGEEYREMVESIAPVDEEFKSTFAGGVSQGLGQVIGMLATGGANNVSQIPKIAKEASKLQGVIKAGKELTKSMTSKQGLVGGSMNASANYKQAINDGATEEEALQFGIENFVVGSIFENLPIQSMFSRIAKMEPNAKILDVIKQGLVGAGEEAVTEGMQTTYENMSADRIYDLNREILSGVGEASAVGGTVGFILNSLMSSLTGRRARVKTTEEKETIDKAIKETEEKIKTVDENNDNVKKNTEYLESVETVKLGKVDFIKNDDELESADFFTSQESADESLNELSKKYPNLEFTVKDNTDKNDPYAEANFTVEAKPKEIEESKEALAQVSQEDVGENILTVKEEDQAQEGDYFTREIGGETIVYEKGKDVSRIVPQDEYTGIQREETPRESTTEERLDVENVSEEQLTETIDTDVQINEKQDEELRQDKAETEETKETETKEVEEEVEQESEEEVAEQRTEEDLQTELDEIISEIADKSKSPKDFVKKTRALKKNIPKEVSSYFYNKYGKGGDLSMEETAKAYIDSRKQPKEDAKTGSEEVTETDVQQDTGVGEESAEAREQSTATVSDSRPRVTFQVFGEELTGTRDGDIILGDDGTRYQPSMVDNIQELTPKNRIEKQKEVVREAAEDVKKKFAEGNNPGIIYDFEKAARDDIKFYNSLRNLVVEYARLKGMQFEQAIKELEKIVNHSINKKSREYIKSVWDEVNQETKKKPIKKTIKESTESKPSKEKNTLVNDYVELKRNLRQQAKASREGQRAEKERVKDLKKGVEDFIKERSKEINSLGAKLSTAILRRVNEVNSEIGLDRALDYIEKVLSDQKLRNEIIEKDSLIAKIKSESDPKKQVKRESEITKSKRRQTAEGISVLKKINEALGMDRLVAEKRIEAIQKELMDNQVGKEAKDGRRLTPDEVFNLQAEMYALNFAGLENFSVKQIKELLNEVKDIKKTDKIDAIERVKQWRDKIDDNISKTEAILDPNNKVNKPSWLLPKIGVRRKVKGFFLMQDNWIWLMDKLSKFDKKSKPLESFLNEKYDQELIGKPNRKEQVERNKTMLQIQDKFTEIFGVKKPSDREKVLTENSTPKPFTYTDTKGETQKVEMSMNAIYKRWMEMQDDTLLPTFDKMNMGVDYLNTLEKEMTPEIKQWAEWQLNEFYPKYAESINKVYKEVFGIDMAIRPNYSPIRRITEGVSDDTDLTFSGQTTLNSVNNGSLKSRVGSKLPLMEMDGDKVLMNYIYQMEFFKAHSLSLKELSQSLLDQKVLTKINQLHGPEYVDSIKSHIDGFYKKGDNYNIAETFMENFRKTFTVSTLSVNPVSFIKQLTSIPAYANWIPAEQWALRTAKFWLNPVKNSRFLHDNSEYIQLRLQSAGYDRDAAAAMSKDWKQSMSGKSKLMNQMMFMTKWGDSAAIFIGGYAIYDYNYDQAIKNGLSPKDAKDFAISKFERATELTQQASDTQNLNLFQKGSEFYKVMTMYKTSPIAYHSLAMGALRNLKYDRGNRAENIKQFAIFHMALPMMFQWASSAFMTPSGEDDPDFWFDMARAGIFGNLNAVFVGGDFVEYLWKNMIEGKPFDYQPNAPLSSFYSNMDKLGDKSFDIIEDFSFMNIMIALDQLARTASQVVPQISFYNQTSRMVDGISSAIQGETEHPIRRSIGWSDWALGENKYQNKQKNRLLEMKLGKDYKKKKKKSVDGTNEHIDFDYSKIK